MDKICISKKSIAYCIWLNNDLVQAEKFLVSYSVIWPHGEPLFRDFLAHLNNQHPSIRFTMEIEENKRLPFLDVQVFRKPDGSLGHSVYRKKTDTNRYLHADSNHHPSQKNSLVNILFRRADIISDSDSRDQEKGISLKLSNITDIKTNKFFHF